MAFAVGYNLLPTERVSELIYKIDTQDEVKEYDVVQPDFDNDYDLDNPATHAAAMKKGEKFYYLFIVKNYFFFRIGRK